MSAGRVGRVTGIYDASYANRYEALYLHPWPAKHELNERNLRRLLAGVSSARPSWLDLGCGQGWQFSRFPSTIRKVGLDLSLPQLLAARRRNPEGAFLCADFSTAGLLDGSFDLVTNFWAGYCYLDSEPRIRDLLVRVVRWTREGGAVYFEVLSPKDLESFNASRYAAGRGFRVFPRSADFRAWGYLDEGGVHLMTSPPVELFERVLKPYFARVEARHDSRFMVHLIATGRRSMRGPNR